MGIRTIQTNLTSQSQMLASMQVKSTSTETEVRDIQNNLKLMQRVNMTLPTIQQQVDRTVVNTTDISDYMRSILETVRTLQGDVAGIVPNLTPLINQLANQNKLTVKSGSKEHDDRVSTIMQSKEKKLIQQRAEASIEQNPAVHVLRESVDKRCTCRARITNNKFRSTYEYNKRNRLRPFALFSLSSAFTHNWNCPMFVLSESSRSVGFRFVYTGPWFGSAMEMTVSFIKRAGVYSISPSLSVRAVVPSDSPAFAAADEMVHRYRQTDFVESFVSKIQSIFQSRAASPYDVDEDGNTLLHVSLSNLQ